MSLRSSCQQPHGMLQYQYILSNAIGSSRESNQSRIFLRQIFLLCPNVKSGSLLPSTYHNRILLFCFKSKM